MARELFPTLLTVRPTALIEANSKLPNLESELPKGSSGNAWKKLVTKVQLGQALNNIEKCQIANNIWIIDPELLVSFKNLFNDRLEQETLFRSASQLRLTLGPAAAVEILANDETIKKFGQVHLSEGLVKYRQCLKEENFHALADLALENEKDLVRFVGSFNVSPTDESFSFGQQKILTHILLSKKAPRLFELSLSLLMKWFSSLSTDTHSAPKALNSLLGKYFENDPNWGNKVLKTDYFLKQIIDYVSKAENSLREELRSQSNIKLLLKQYDAINNVLGKLNDIEPDRGEFWRAFVEFTDYVKPRSFSGRIEACAFAFSEYVIVEFAPTGNAAIFYDRRVFDEVISKSSSWKQVGEAKILPQITRGDGTFWHVTGWQKELKLFLLSDLKRLNRRTAG